MRYRRMYFTVAGQQCSSILVALNNGLLCRGYKPAMLLVVVLVGQRNA